MENIKRSGRPNKYATGAMNAATKMQEYRRRQRVQLEQAGDNPTEATDKVLAECLLEVFKHARDDQEVQQFLIEKYLQELSNRYEIIKKK